MTNQVPQVTPDEAREKFGEKMRELELKEKEKEVERKGAAAGVPYVNLKGFPISPEAIALIDEERARAISAVCFLYTGSDFRVGATDPSRQEIKEIMFQIAERTHTKGALYIISPESLSHALLSYGRLPKYRAPTKGVSITAEDLQKFGTEFRNFAELQERIKGVTVSDVVTLLTSSALSSLSSDIHIEAEEGEVAVRFRIDGALHKVASLPKTDWQKIISRVKLLAGLKLNVTDRPQDGRFTITAKDDTIDVRVSTIPTGFGESAVLRLLRLKATGLAFEDIGLRGAVRDQLAAQIERPNGMIITTGPTGSGKTTTLYAILSKLNDPETKIITLEDPIEYKLPGISQSQIDPSKDYTFASGLRSILRQDPDIVMVGEIRDLETAEIAIQAALTGHLVLSTVHTNSASGAIPRFLALGAKQFLLAPALNAVMAQRLVRKIHEECKAEAKLDEKTIGRVKEILDALPKNSQYKVDLSKTKFYRGDGCARCFDLGYKGRTGIYEIMIMNKELEEIILSGKVAEYAIQELAVKNGMITMVQDGLLKALDGITTVEEVFSVAE